MYAERLLTLSSALWHVPAARFDMQRFYTFPEGVQRPDIGFRGKRKPLTDISKLDATCALGFATFMPEFNELGLRPGVGEYGIHTPYYKGHFNLFAAASFFDIRLNVTGELFGARKVGPRQKAKAIRQFVEAYR